jgi:hypothetical protein
MTKGEAIMNMVISPKHAATIDQVIQLFYARVMQELVPAVGYTAPPERSLEELRTGPLAKNLRAIARYAEGYQMTSNGDILANIRIVGRLLYGNPMQRGFKMPPDLHKTPLGELIYEALCRRTPRELRMDVSETRKLLNVSRQTVHQWAQDGTLQPIYDQGQLTFQKAQVEALKQKRDQPKP